MGIRKVAILYGGRSVEHGVSINSARNIVEFIDRKKFLPIPIGVNPAGKWFLTKSVDRSIDKGNPLSLSLDTQKPGFKTRAGKTFQVDVVFPLLHGTDGEDGSVQGLLKSVDLPVVGTGVLGSALSMNKIVAKRLFRESGIPVTDFIAVSFHDKLRPSFEEVSDKLGLPFMVKAASLGSSVGVTKVKDKKDFQVGVDAAFRFDDELLFEKFVSGREIECAILGNEPPVASLPGEIIVGKNHEFYTFDAKYVDPNAVSIQVPAQLKPDEVASIREISVRAFQALKCKDYARVDLFLAPGQIYVNEINTIPGFTNSSMYPMMWKERGTSFTQLITKLITLSAARHKQENRIERRFKSGLKY